MIIRAATGSTQICPFVKNRQLSLREQVAESRGKHMREKKRVILSLSQHTQDWPLSCVLMNEEVRDMQNAVQKHTGKWTYMTEFENFSPGRWA